MQLVAAAVLTGLAVGGAPDCGGHGVCDAGGGDACTCYDSDALGHWDTTGDCAPGWAGPECTQPCDGGACLPCSGHGACDGGFTGTGECHCARTQADGWWGGAACSECAEGYYGALCLEKCDADACSGHGACRDGRGGDGACECEDGWDPDAACGACLPYRWGKACENDCYGVTYSSTAPAACSGHGTCDAGLTGSGICVACGDGFAGRRCEIPCACNAEHGACSDGPAGDGSCVCNDNRLPPSCAECEGGYGGYTCGSRCPGEPPCSNHGVCETRGRSARCQCEPGYAGDDCSQACDGRVPCWGHGLCTVALFSSTCACGRGADPPGSLGYWDNRDSCFTCAGHMSGHTDLDNLCKMECPVGRGGGGASMVCSGRGRCVEGKCLCDLKWMHGVAASSCGDACEFDEAACQAGGRLCDAPGHFGFPGCTYTCPGMVPDAAGVQVPCSGHGYCLADGAKGECVCDPPAWTNATDEYIQYGGAACDVRCPVSNATRTSCGYPAHGVCTTEGACVCKNGYFGPSCGGACPKVYGKVCNGRGECGSGAAGTGLCTCEAGWAGPACEIQCNCPGHSICDLTNGTCSCTAGYTGAACSDCPDGRYGDACSETCYGTTVGTGCYCDAAHTGADCSALCPAGNTSAAPCNGHGNCFNGDLACTCDDGWFGEACTAACTEAACNATLGPRAVCSDAGACICAPQFSGASCSACSAGFWGNACENACECSGHGVCDPAHGGCTCHSSPEDGFFVGARCQSCAPKYTGVRCDYPKVCTTQGRSPEAPTLQNFAGSRAPVKAEPPYALWVDTRAGGGFAVAGGAPLVAWVVGRPDEVAVLDAASPAAGAQLRALFPAPGGALHVVFAAGNTAATQLVTFDPAPRPLAAGTQDPFAAASVQTLSTAEAKSVSLVAHGGSTFAFTLDPLDKVVRAVSIPCGAAVCAGGAAVAVPPHTTTIAAGRGVLFLAGGGEAGFYSVAFTAELTFGPLVPLALPRAVHVIAINFLEVYNGVGLVAVARDANGDTVVMKWDESHEPLEENWLLWPGLPTALAVDELLQAAFLAFDTADGTSPGEVVKISLAEERPVIYDRAPLGHAVVQGRGVVPDVIRAFYIDTATRTLYGLVSPATSMKLASFLLWEVRSNGGDAVAPAAVDAAGGTPVTITGAGFQRVAKGAMIPTDIGRVVGGVGCVWGAARTVTAGDLVGADRVICRAPPASLDCEAEAVAVTLDGERATDCGDAVTRVHSPAVHAAAPEVGGRAGGAVVTVHGIGFTETEELACIFVVGCVEGSDTADPCAVPCAAYEEMATAPGVYVSPQEITCVQPPFTAHGAGRVGVTLDGCRSGAFVEYDVVGAAAGIRVAAPASAPSSPLDAPLSGAGGLPLPDVSVAFVDSYGRRIVDAAAVDAGWRVTVTACRRAGGAPCELRGTSTQPVDGAALIVFSGIALAQPRAGDVQVEFEGGAAGWRATLYVRVVAGAADRLVFLRQPAAAAAWRGAPLAVQPRLGVLDADGALLAAVPGEIPVACAVVAADSGGAPAQDHPEYTAVIRPADAAADFESVGVLALFDVAYTLHCRSPGLAPAVSTPIRARPCAPYQRAVPGDASCRPCPADRMCDGTGATLVRPGYWRAASDVSQRCLKPEGCLGGAGAAPCAEGHSGVVCDVCGAGWMDIRVACVECEPMLLLGAFVLTAVGMVLAVAAAAVCCALGDLVAGGPVEASNGNPLLPAVPPDPEPRAASAAPLLLRLAVDHAATTAVLGGAYVPWSWGLGAPLGLSEVVLGMNGVDCWLRYFGATRAAVLIVGLITPLVVALSAACLANAALKWTARYIAQRRAAAAPEAPTYGAVLRTTATMAVLISSTPCVYAAFTLLACYAPPAAEGAARVLFDMRLPCNHGWFVPAIATAVLGGGVLPIAAYAQTAAAPPAAVREVAGLLPLHRGCLAAGYAPGAASWTAFALLRRVGVAGCMAFFGPAPAHQLAAASWVLLAASAAEVHVQPVGPARSSTAWVHAASLVALAATAGFGRFLAADPESVSAKAGVLTVNALFWVALVLLLARAARSWWAGIRQAWGRKKHLSAVAARRDPVEERSGTTPPLSDAGTTDEMEHGARAHRLDDTLRTPLLETGSNEAPVSSVAAASRRGESDVDASWKGLHTTLSYADAGDCAMAPSLCPTSSMLLSKVGAKGAVLPGLLPPTQKQRPLSGVLRVESMPDGAESPSPTCLNAAQRSFLLGGLLQKTESVLLPPGRDLSRSPPSKPAPPLRVPGAPSLVATLRASSLLRPGADSADANASAASSHATATKSSGALGPWASLGGPAPALGPTCQYCGTRYIELLNKNGACPKSPLSAKRHLASVATDEDSPLTDL